MKTSTNTSNNKDFKEKFNIKVQTKVMKITKIRK